MIVELNYNDTKIPVSVGYYALKRFKMKTGKEFESTEDDDIEALGVMFWFSLEAGYKLQKQENPYKEEDVDLILNECMMEFIKVIPDFFQESPTPPTTAKSIKETKKRGK